MPVKLSYQNVGTLPQVALWSKQIIPLESSETLRILSSSAKAMNDSVCYYGKQFNDSEGLTMQEFKDLGSQARPITSVKCSCTSDVPNRTLSLSKWNVAMRGKTITRWCQTLASNICPESHWTLHSAHTPYHNRSKFNLEKAISSINW